MYSNSKTLTINGIGTLFLFIALLVYIILTKEVFEACLIIRCCMLVQGMWGLFFPKEQETHKRELKVYIKKFSQVFYQMYKFKALDKLF